MTDKVRQRSEIIVLLRLHPCSCSVRFGRNLTHSSSPTCISCCQDFSDWKTKGLRGLKHSQLSIQQAIWICTMSYASTSETYRLQKVVVDQLRTEKNVSRIKVSEAANELKSYVEKIQHDDPLVTGVPGNQNPFKEKSSCTLIWELRRIKIKLRSYVLMLNWNARSMDNFSISRCDRLCVLLCLRWWLFLWIFPARLWMSLHTRFLSVLEGDLGQVWFRLDRKSESTHWR